jgi:nitroreductase
MDTFEALYNRRSIRGFDRTKKIPEGIVEKILQASGYALSWPGNYFPWRLIIIRDQEMKDLLGNCAKEVAKVIFGGSFELFGLGHLWYLPKDTQLAVAEYTTTGELWEYPRDSYITIIPTISDGGWQDTITSLTEYHMTLSQYLGFATQNMWLVGHSYGVGAGYNGMPLVDSRRREVVSEYLGIPPSWIATGAFSFGYAKEPRYFGPTRPPLEGMVFSEYWGNPYVRAGLRGARYEANELPKTDLEETIKNINLVRSFGQAPVPDWMLERIMDVAIWGPVPENFKAWRLIIIRDEESKKFLQDCVKYKANDPWTYKYPELQYGRLSHIPKEDRVAEIEKMFDRGFGDWFTQADVLILVVSGYVSWRDQPNASMSPGQAPMYCIACGNCTQNMMIAATALGLGLNYDPLIGGDGRVQDRVFDYFGIPGGTWLLHGILGLGEAGEKEDVVRPKLEELVFDEQWGNVHQPATE